MIAKHNVGRPLYDFAEYSAVSGIFTPKESGIADWIVTSVDTDWGNSVVVTFNDASCLVFAAKAGVSATLAERGKLPQS